jgi:ligand-binding sensor domain-containing protein
MFRKGRWLPGVALIAAQVCQLSAANAAVYFGEVTDFHHAEWQGLGAIFDIKQSAEGYLWLTTSRGVLRFDGARFQSMAEVTRGPHPILR